MTQNTRSDKRAKVVSLLVRYKSTTVEQFIENSSHDVGRDGVFVKSPTPFAVGTLLRFELRLATEVAVLSGVGRVVWKREPTQAAPDKPAGMGLAFVRLEDAARAVVDRLLKEKPDAGRAYGAEPPSREHLPRPDEGLSSVNSINPAPVVLSDGPPSTAAPQTPRSAVGSASAQSSSPGPGQQKPKAPRVKPLSVETPRAVLARPAAGRSSPALPAAGRPSEPRLPVGTMPDPEVDDLIASSSGVPVMSDPRRNSAGSAVARPNAEDDDDDHEEGTVVMANAPAAREAMEAVPFGETLDPVLLAAAAAHRGAQRDPASGERLALGAVSTPRGMLAAPSMIGAPSGHMQGAPSGHMMMGPPSGHMMGPPSGHLLPPSNPQLLATPSAPMVGPVHPGAGWLAHGSQPAIDLDLLHPSAHRRSGRLLAALLGMIALLLVVIVLMLVGGGFFLFKTTRAPVAQQVPASASPATASLPTPSPSAPAPAPAPTPVASASPSVVPPADPVPAAVVDAGAPAAAATKSASAAPTAPPHYVGPYRRPAAPAQPQLPAWARDPSANDPEIIPTKPAPKH